MKFILVLGILFLTQAHGNNSVHLINDINWENWPRSGHSIATKIGDENYETLSRVYAYLFNDYRLSNSIPALESLKEEIHFKKTLVKLTTRDILILYYFHIIDKLSSDADIYFIATEYHGVKFENMAWSAKVSSVKSMPFRETISKSAFEVELLNRAVKLLDQLNKLESLNQGK